MEKHEAAQSTMYSEVTMPSTDDQLTDNFSMISEMLRGSSDFYSCFLNKLEKTRGPCCNCLPYPSPYRVAFGSGYWIMTEQNHDMRNSI